jgi:hypothetical protein
VLNRLSLRIEYRALRHHPNVCFHAPSITSAAQESLSGEEEKNGGRESFKNRDGR